MFYLVLFGVNAAAADTGFWCAFVVKFNSTVVGHELRRSLKYTIVKEDSSFNQVVRLLSSPVRSNKYTVFNK